jgi:tripartite-type tricarboxylate transporter receptor subunit TctC
MKSTRIFAPGTSQFKEDVMKFRLMLPFAVLAVAGFAVAEIAVAQTWPTKPVTLVVPFAPAGSTDLVVRALAPGLEAVLKQPAIVENRPGAGGMLGAAEVARASADGYTMLFQSNGVKIAPLFQKDISYDPADLRPIVGVASAYYVAVSSPKVPAKTFADFINYAKGRQKSLNFATVPYTPLQLEAHAILQRAGLPEIDPIAYNGAAGLVQAVARGDTAIGFTGSSSALALWKAGQLSIIANTSPQRTAELPDVPTLREQGLDITAGYTFGIFVHAKTPQAIVDRIIDGVTTAAKSPEVAKRLVQLSFVEADHRNFEQQMARENTAFADVARRIGLKPQ